MRVLGRVVHGTLAMVLILTMVLPMPAWSAVASAGTARGVRAVELSLDAGKTWLPLGATSMPVLDGTQIRSRNGGAIIDFSDGSRLNLLPFSAIGIHETGKVSEVSVSHGRVTFQLPVQTRLELRSAAARLEPTRDQAMAGELFVGGDGTIGLKMTQGQLRVEELGGARRTMMASLEPVFLPKRSAMPGPLFSADVPAESPAAGAKAVFSPKGESLGYLQLNKQLVIRPGYTADMTQPFPPKTVQLALAKVPAPDRIEAMPVFDVNGGYVGYLAGPVFHAQAVGAPAPPPGAAGQVLMAQAVGGGSGAGGGASPWWYVGALVLGAGLVIGGLCLAEEWPCEDNGGSGGAGAGSGVATSLRPRR